MSGAVLAALGEACVRSTVVVAAVGTILVALRIRSGSVRHKAWVAVALAMLAMPLVPRRAPGLVLPLPVVSVAIPRASRVDVGAPASDTERAEPTPVTTASALAARASAGPSAGAERPEPWWPVAAFVLWASVAFVCLARSWRGVRLAGRLRRSSLLVTPSGATMGDLARGVPVAQSPWISSPVTIGVRSPRIILPVAWRSWPAATLRAVLAHEAAHVRRRDPLVALVAALNRCLFWFHPLAWWLERAVGAAAEDACDAAGVNAVEDARAYASVLLAMADSVRRHGGRLSWAAPGMGGRLDVRIHRVLRGDAQRGEPGSRVALALAAALLAIVFGATCRPSLVEFSRVKAEPSRSARAARRLGERYGAAIVGSYRLTRGRVVVAPPVEPLARAARRRLEASDDPVVLLAAAEYIDRAPKPLPWATDGDRIVEACLRRALRLAPESVEAHTLGVELEARSRLGRVAKVVRTVPLAAEEAFVSSLPEPERFTLLPDLAMTAYDRATSAAAAGESSLVTYVGMNQSVARALAEEALRLAPRFRDDSRRGAPVARAHVTLGLLDLAAGDRAAAVRHLKEASRAPASEELAYARDFEGRELAQALLDAGEGAAVADALERIAAVNVVRRADLLAWAAAIRRGQRPSLLPSQEALDPV